MTGRRSFSPRRRPTGAEPTTAPPRTTLGSLEISRILTGLWQVADQERAGSPLDPATVAADMARYVAAGFTTFDLADHYGSAEDLVGAFRARPESGRAGFLTKWVPAPGPITKALVRSAVGQALRRMKTDSLDLLQFHAWRYQDPAWLEALFHLDALRREGLIQALGVTNFDTAHLRVAVASGIPIVSNQISYSLLDRRAAAGMTALCREHGIGILAYGTVAGGWLSDRWLGRQEPKWEREGTWSQMKYGRFIRAAGGWDRFQALLSTLAAVARHHGVSITNVATRAVIDRPAVAGVIVGARLGETDHIADNARVFDLELTDADRAEIEAAVDQLDPIPGDCGDEYRKPPFLTAAGDLSHHLSEAPAPYPTRPGAEGRTICLSGTEWESIAGFARAVRTGDRILVSGTTATLGSRLIGGADPAAQAHFVIDRLEGAIESLGGRLSQVIRTRIYVSDLAHWEPVARVHGERFGAVQPANTLVRADLVGDGYLVEMEAEAVVDARD